MELRTIIPPEGDVGNFELPELINVADIQCMMENFFRIAHIPMALLDLKGKILVGVGFQEICTKFHRVHPETSKNCIESDIKLTADIPKGESRLYKCRNGMWDLATPIFIGDHRIGNLFMGQFFFRDETIDFDHFRAQAIRYNFNSEAYIESLKKVPQLDKKDIENAKAFFVKLADSLSQLSYSNFKLARAAEENRKLTESLHRDIIDRKKAEKLLEESKTHLERSQEIAHLGSWELDLKTNKLTWSDEVYRIFGLLPGQFTANYEAFLEAVHPDDRAAVNDTYWSSVKNNQNGYEIEHRIVRKKSGEIRIVLEKCEHFRNESGEIIRSIGMVHDITDNKKAEKELKESKEKLSIALEIGNIGIWEWNLHTDEMYLDPRMEKMLGLDPGRFNGTFHDFESLLSEEDITQFRNTICHSLNELSPFETIFRIKTNNNEEKHINAKAIVEYDDSGGLVKLTGISFDITEMKKGAEQVMFKMNEELLRSNKALEQFAYVASHDLQEPLRTVSCFTQLLSKKYNNVLDDTAQEYVQYSVDGAERMYDMINALLAYSKVQTHGKEFRLVDMNLIMNLVMKNLSVQIKNRDASVTFDRLPGLLADENQMVQLLQNLVSNAVKFGRRLPQVHISCKEEPGFHIFSVSDNGIGIEPQYFDRIFKIFQRLVPKNEVEGTGIGLAICKIIVERHGGKIWVESEPGKGSIFYFTIPDKA